MATCVSDYSVDIINREVVVPLLPSQHHSLPLSNIDLTFPPVSFHIVFCYTNPSEKSFASVLSHLKISLSRAFVPYYVLVGRLVLNRAGEPELQCNNNGAEFLEAYAATVISEVNLYNPDESVQGKLVPPLAKTFHDNGTPVFAVQVTRFRCGGFVVGCTFDHRITDGYSANMFLTCWAKLSRDESIESLYPSFTRSILWPRDPPSYCSAIENIYFKPPPKESDQKTPQVSRIYYLDAQKIENLQTSASENGTKCSKFEAFCAYLWKLLMHAKGVEDAMMSRMAIAVDGRHRLRNMGMPPNYYGNVLVFPIAEASAGHIKNESHSWAAKVIHGAIQSAANEESFQSLIDLVETVRPASLWPKIYCKKDDISSGAPSVLVSSGLRFGFNADCGWGKPKFGGLYLPLGGEAGYVMPMMGPSGDGSWVVFMHLLPHHIQAIESNSQGVLCPITKMALGL